MNHCQTLRLWIWWRIYFNDHLKVICQLISLDPISTQGKMWKSSVICSGTSHVILCKQIHGNTSWHLLTSFDNEFSQMTKQCPFGQLIAMEPICIQGKMWKSKVICNVTTHVILCIRIHGPLPDTWILHFITNWVKWTNTGHLLIIQIRDFKGSAFTPQLLQIQRTLFSLHCYCPGLHSEYVYDTSSRPIWSFCYYPWFQYFSIFSKLLPIVRND